MLSNFFALLGNAAVSIFAFFVKLNPMWAYRFTSNLKYGNKFLLGADKEVKVIKKLFTHGMSKEKIGQYHWSKETQEIILSNTSLAGIFITNIWCEDLFDAAMRNDDERIRLQACTQRKYTPNERQILNLANRIYFQQNNVWYKRALEEECLEELIQHHSGAITASVLNKFTKQTQDLFLELAVKYNTATPVQVSWALEKCENIKYWNYIKRFITLMPLAPKQFNLFVKCVNEWHGELFYKKWVEEQTAATLCHCALQTWVKERNEQNLRLIEQKVLIENNFECARQLVMSTRQFHFLNAVDVVLQNNQATTGMLYHVDQDSYQYPQLVEQLLNNSETIITLTPQQVAKFSDEHRNLYWKNMALFKHITAQQYAELPEGELKNEISQILEDNARIMWFLSHEYIGKYHKLFEKEFGDIELSSRVQCQLIEQKLFGWLVIYFCGPHIERASKIAFGTALSITSNRTTKHLSFDAFKMLVDSSHTGALNAYLSIFNAILPAKREYLLCSSYKGLAVGIGTR